MSDRTEGISHVAVIAGGIALAGMLWLLRDLLVLIGISLVLAYALDPPVSLLERLPLGRGRRLPRNAASAAVVLLLVLFAGWLLALVVPRLFAELAHFLEGVPTLASNLLDTAQREAASRGLSGTVDPLVADLRNNSTERLREMGGAMTGLLGKLFGGIGSALAFVLVPVLSLYLLAERDDVRDSLMRFIPESEHDRWLRGEEALDRALRSYVRGQAAVCVVMGTVVGLALALMGFPYALLLAVIIGIAEVLPIIGALVVSIAIALAGLSISVTQAILGLVVYLVINWAVGAFVTPRLMGHHLKMHAFIVTVSVLAGATLLGGAGAMLALPAAAGAQALVEEFRPRRKDRSETRKGA
jgi:predicted PurR-regulated permease PerM